MGTEIIAFVLSKCVCIHTGVCKLDSFVILLTNISTPVDQHDRLSVTIKHSPQDLPQSLSSCSDINPYKYPYKSIVEMDFFCNDKQVTDLVAVSCYYQNLDYTHKLEWTRNGMKSRRANWTGVDDICFFVLETIF